ncbi:hypothetical protein T440DRAFT_472726, partial [Plenodomus tracheiphilus IPT5]
MSNSPEASGSVPEEEDDDHCGCASCIAHHMAPVQHLENGKKKQKRYVAPLPDDNTFATQQDFLDSLSPIAVDHVESNNLKCPICWKTYGEAPDPGFDNSELPVKLRCHHVFGQKCLANTFAIPKENKVELRRLSFSLGSRGAALGHRLHTYATQHRIDLEGNSGSQHSTAETFSKMMQEAFLPKRGRDIFGEFWWPILQYVRNAISQTGRGIRFMENAVVLDSIPPQSPDVNPPAHGVKSGTLTLTTTDINQPLSQANLLHDFDSVKEWSLTNQNGLPPPPLNHPGASFYSGMMPPTCSHPSSGFPGSFPLGFPPGSTSPTGPSAQSAGKGGQSPQLAKGWVPQLTSVQPFHNVLGESSALEQVPVSGPVPQIGASSQSSGTWESVLTAETNLDKLTALNKKAQHISAPDAFSPGQILHLDTKMMQSIDAQKNIVARLQAQARLVSPIQKTMSAALAEIYAQYLEEAPRLAPDVRTEQKPNIVHTSVLMHERDAMVSEHRIPSPPFEVQYFDENKNDVDDDQTATVDDSPIFFILTRNHCPMPCCSAAKKKRVMEWAVPRALWWRN